MKNIIVISARLLAALALSGLMQAHADPLSGKTVLSVQKAGAGTPNRLWNTNNPTLKFATYNIGKNEASNNVNDFGKLIDAIGKLDADVISVTEIDKNTRRSGNIDQLKTLADALKLHYAFGDVLEFDGGQYGIGLLSKYPIAKSQLVKLPSGDAEQRGVLIAEVHKPGFEHPIIVMTTHLDWQKDPTIRLMQVRRIMDLAIGDAPSDFPDIASAVKILAGDFNSTAREQPMQELKAMWNIVDDDLEDHRSWPAINPALDLDHILTWRGQKWHAKSISVMNNSVSYKWSAVSDHLPVVAELKLLEQ